MSLIQHIDALLPQTQCGKCGHPGCQPYAEGIANGEAINKCPPGGRETIAALAELLNVPVLELDISRGPAPAQIAFIREAECIGCTKCIQACPIDAIVGAAKLMHTVIIDECTGCDLCVAPCPVDCIEMRPLTGTPVLPIVGGLAVTPEDLQARTRKRNHARQRFEQRNARLHREEQQKIAERAARAKNPVHPSDTANNPVLDAIARVQAQKAETADAALKKAKINVAMSRAQLHKSLKAFGHPPTFEQQAQLITLAQQLDAAELALHTAEDASEKPAPQLVRIEKRPIDPQLRQLKTELAYARADLSKLERQANTPTELLDKARARLDEAQRQVNDHAAP
ncbi:electron transport complex protein RnfB [Pseudomonas sp. ok272]|uniref:electron transport complex subunit RsxB n=1 Tax=unclassified Pseudomonas TaxID=196821 RepID=UPI0008CBA82F|nr:MULTISPECIES: electron transport complex subunit RsxB [unclassified Pseudomonas]SEN13620.1 electron transport complex protein RnfB [Pseudomonas sp. ok272]SFN06246.1 electron transport complex protein RnfB [Pseudomonas sp. ok602]